jgi:glycosyltransferase involved in cell wall biosynthesis
MAIQDPSTRYVIFLATSKQATLFDALPNVEAHVVPSRSKLWWDQVSVPRAARRLKVDLIFNPKFSVPLLTRLPSAFVLQDSDWYVNPQNYPWWDILYIRSLLPIYCRKAKRVLVISQSTLNDLERYRVLKGHKATVTHAAVSDNFTATRDEAALADFRRRLHLPPAFILTATRAYHTGHPKMPPYPGGNNERLIRAYRKYRQGGGTLPLVVAGHRVQEYLQQRGFSESDLSDVQFIGFVPNAQMQLAYQSAEFFVLVKLCESFGLPILEALSSGCPAIVPSTCASPEVAGGAARLVDPYNEEDIAAGMLELAQSPELRQSLRARGLERARAFTWADTARKTLAVLNEM